LKRSLGFTLVELLVIIAIIAVLLAITLPALTYSRLIVYQITCLNNLKQLGIAVETYVQSYKYYPVCIPEVSEKWSDFLADRNIASDKMLGVPVSLWPFCQNAATYNCPILSKANADISYCYNWVAGKKYGAEEVVIKPFFDPPLQPPKEEKIDIHLLTPEKVKSPATFIILYDLPMKPQEARTEFTEYDPYKDIDPDDYKSYYRDPNKEGYLADANLSPHRGGFNILFSDGHTKWHKGWNDSEMTRSFK
jgi:prepilin-type processing-associated H-X9-DG protein